LLPQILRRKQHTSFFTRTDVEGKTRLPDAIKGLEEGGGNVLGITEPLFRELESRQKGKRGDGDGVELARRKKGKRPRENPTM